MKLLFRVVLVCSYHSIFTIVCLQFNMAANLPISVPESAKNDSIDYYDIMVIGRTGMGKSTTSDKLIIANPDHVRDYRGEQHPDETVANGQVIMGDLTMWLLSNATVEVDQVTKRLKDLIMSRSLENPHLQVNEVYQGSGNPTTGCQVVSNEVTKVRVLDVPGFFGEDIGEIDGKTLGDRVLASGLSIMREILQIQSRIQMKIRRIIYFVPQRGALERSHKILMMELEQMVHYFGRSLFECMVLAATISPEVYDFIPEGVTPFKDSSEATTRKLFLEALTPLLLPGEQLPVDKPPLIFISLRDSCEAILEKVKNAPVIRDELRLAFDHRTCVRCGLKAKFLPGENNELKKVACYAGDDPTASIPYEESKCHPWIISKYWKITKIVGGIAHYVTLKKLEGWWPDFRNPDDEVCVECGKVPGQPGCKKIGSRFRLEDKIYRVDHSPSEPVAVADQEHPGGIVIPMPGEEQGEEDQPPVDEQLPLAEGVNAAANEDDPNQPADQQQHEGDIPIPAPMELDESNEHGRHDQNIEQNASGSNNQQQEVTDQASSQGQAHSQTIAVQGPREDVADACVANSPNLKG